MGAALCARKWNSNKHSVKWIIFAHFGPARLASLTMGYGGAS